MKKYKANKVVTHDRYFHIDEVFAIALLEVFYFKGDSFELIRTKDNALLNQFVNDKNVFMIDVGFNYNEKLLNFDHHQRSFNEKWKDNTPYSSCGLIWNFLKKNNYLSELSDEHISIFERDLIKRIDQQDNGIRPFKELNFISSLNRNHHDNNFIDSQFKKALKLANDFLIIRLDYVLKGKHTDLFLEYKNNDFLDMFTSVSILKNFGFVNKHKLFIDNKENTVHFDYINLKNKKEKIIINFNNSMFEVFNEDNENIFKTMITDGYTAFVWEYLKQLKIINQKMNDNTVKLIEDNVISHFKKDTFFKEAAFIYHYENIFYHNYYFNTNSETYSFQEMYNITNSCILSLFSELKNRQANEKTINKMINKSKDLNGIVLFEQNIKSAPKYLEDNLKNIFIAIFPVKRNQWQIRVIDSKNNTQKIQLPKQWLGLKDDKLKDISKEPLIFCHKTGFMCVFEGSKEESINFANKLIENNLVLKNKQKRKTKLNI